MEFFERYASVLATLLLVIVVVVKYVLERIWRDQRTNLNRRLSKALLFLECALPFVILFAGFNQSGKLAELESKLTAANSTLGTLRDSLTSVGLEMRRVHESLDSVSGRLKPFEQFALKLFPRMSSDSALGAFANALDQRFDDLSGRVSRLDYKISSGYYVDLSGRIQDGVRSSLMKVAARCAGTIDSVVIMCLENPEQLRPLTHELGEILGHAGFRCGIASYAAFGRAFGPPAVIKGNSRDSSCIARLRNALVPAVLSAVTLSLEPASRPGLVVLDLSGVPVYNGEGQVTFR